MPRKILNVPFEVEGQIKARAVILVTQVLGPHQETVNRLEVLDDALADMWKRGYQAKESFGFRWGLIIGAATGVLSLGLLQWLGSLL